MRPEEATFRNLDLDWLQAPFVKWDIVTNQTAEGVENGSHRDRPGGIEVIGTLRASTREIDLGSSGGMVHRYSHFQRSPIIHEVRERAVAYSIDDPADALLRVVHHMLHINLDDRPAVLLDHLTQLPNT